MSEDADLFYGGDESLLSSFEPALSDAANLLADLNGWTADERAAHVLEAARFYDDARLPAQLASGLHQLVARHSAAPADEGTLDEWSLEARRAVRERFGMEEGDRRFQVARAFVAARPVVAKMLTETGVGSHRALVMALAEQADAIPKLRLTPRKRST